jgi:hypothetical protein
MEYHCTYKSCSYEGPGSYIIVIPEEICADEHNCATLFCPHCRKKLVKRDK